MSEDIQLEEGSTAIMDVTRFLMKMRNTQLQDIVIDCLIILSVRKNHSVLKEIEDMTEGFKIADVDYEKVQVDFRRAMEDGTDLA